MISCFCAHDSLLFVIPNNDVLSFTLCTHKSKVSAWTPTYKHTFSLTKSFSGGLNAEDFSAASNKLQIWAWASLSEWAHDSKPLTVNAPAAEPTPSHRGQQSGTPTPTDTDQHAAPERRFSAQMLLWDASVIIWILRREMLGGDLVAVWEVALSDGVYRIEFAHGTTTGKRVIYVNGQVRVWVRFWESETVSVTPRLWLMLIYTSFCLFGSVKGFLEDFTSKKNLHIIRKVRKQIYFLFSDLNSNIFWPK